MCMCASALVHVSVTFIAINIMNLGKHMPNEFMNTLFL